MVRPKETIIFSALFLCIVCLYFWDCLSLKTTFISGDYLQQFYPWSSFYSASIKNFTMPLWVKHLQSGFPLFAEGQTGMLYPLNILMFFVLPFQVAYNYSFLLHFFLAGLFMYFYCRKMGAGREGAFLGSILLCFGSVYAGNFVNIATLKSLCFFPAVLFIFENYSSSQNKRMGIFVIIGAIWGIQLLSGSTQMTFYAIGISILYFFYRNHLTGHSAITVLKCVVIATVVAIVLSAPQLYATFELAKYSNRIGQTLNFALWGSFSPLATIGLVYPSFGQAFCRNNVMYIGLIGLFFAIVGSFKVKEDADNRSLLVFFIIALFCALGKYNPLYVGLIRILRLYSLRMPSKFAYFAVFFISALSAKGFSLCFDERPKELLSKAYKVFVSILSLVVVIFLGAKAAMFFFGSNILDFLKKYAAENIYGKSFHRYSLDTYMDKVESKFFLLQDKLSLYHPLSLFGIIMIVVMVVMVSLILKYRKKRLTKYICLGIILLDLMVYGYIVEGPRTSLGKYDTSNIKNPRIYETIQEDSSIYRIYPFGPASGMPDWAYFSMNMVHDRDSIGLYTPIVNRDYMLKLEGLGVVDDSIGVLPAKKDVIDNKTYLLRELNVKYVISSEQLNSSVLNKIDEEDGVFLYVLKGYFPRFMFSLSKNSNNAYKADISVKEYSSGFAEIEVISDKDGYILFSEKYYPGWKASIDGSSVEIERYSDILQAIKLSSGRHKVIFKYDPLYFRILFPVHVLGFVGVMIWAVIYFRKGRNDKR